MSHTKRRGRVTSTPQFRSFFLNLQDKELKKKISNMIDVLELNPHAGDYVKGSLWPDYYVEMGLNNVYRYDLDASRRLTYTLRPLDSQTFEVAIVELFPTHKEYAKRFGYKS